MTFFRALRVICFSIAIAVAMTENLPASELQRWTESDQPHFVLPSLSGADIALNSRHGSLILVHFFATWCEPCREELPALRRLVARSPQSGVVVLAISVAEVDERVRRFMESLPVNFPVLLDRDRVVARAWRVHTLPTTFILDSALKPRLVVEGDFAWDSITSEGMIAMFTSSQLGAGQRDSFALAATGKQGG